MVSIKLYWKHVLSNSFKKVIEIISYIGWWIEQILVSPQPNHRCGNKSLPKTRPYTAKKKEVRRDMGMTDRVKNANKVKINRSHRDRVPNACPNITETSPNIANTQPTCHEYVTNITSSLATHSEIHRQHLAILVPPHYHHIAYASPTANRHVTNPELLS